MKFGQVKTAVGFRRNDDIFTIWINTDKGIVSAAVQKFKWEQFGADLDDTNAKFSVEVGTTSNGVTSFARVTLTVGDLFAIRKETVPLPGEFQ